MCLDKNNSDEISDRDTSDVRIIFPRPAKDFWILVPLPNTNLPEAVRPEPSKCLCGMDLRGSTVKGYPHESGWKVPGHDEPFWLYVECPRCRTQKAISYLRVPVGFDFTEKFEPAIPGSSNYRSPYIPTYIEIITERPGTDEGENVELIFLRRELTEYESGRLLYAKSPEEVRYLASDITPLAEPVVYEVDFGRV